MREKRESDFWRSQVYERRESLLRDRALYLAVLVGLVFAIATPHLPFHALNITDLAGVGLAYAALSFGAAVSGCILALGVPGPDRLKRWSMIPGSKGKFSALSDLVFVFAWAAIAQIAVVLVCFLAFVFGSGYQVLPTRPAPSHAVAFTIAMMICFYALFELTAVVRSLVQVAAAIIDEEKPRPDSKGSATAAPRVSTSDSIKARKDR
jgi:hypothetical protein